MKANVKLMGYTGLVKVIEETETGYEIEILEGTMTGKKTFISKNSQNETIAFNNEKFTSKFEYTVGKEYNKDTETEQVVARYVYLTITAKDEKTASTIWGDCYEYLSRNASFELQW